MHSVLVVVVTAADEEGQPVEVSLATTTSLVRVGEGEPPRATAVLLLELFCVSALCSLFRRSIYSAYTGLASSLAIYFVNTYIPYMTYPICSPARVRVRLFSSDFPQGILFFFPSTFFYICFNGTPL